MAVLPKESRHNQTGLNECAMENEFLTSIAQGHHPGIKSVEFEPLACHGVVYKTPKTGTYVISIDPDRTLCAYFRIFVLFHEVAHVVKYHLGYRKYMMRSSDKESEADNWAFERMGISDRPADPNRLCCRCMKERSKVCLREGRNEGHHR